MTMFDYLAAPGFQPFTIAALVLVGLCAIEGVSMLIGHTLSGMIDQVLHIDHADLHIDHIGHPGALDHSGSDSQSDQPHGNFPHGLLGTFYDWLNAGRVPL